MTFVDYRFWSSNSAPINEPGVDQTKPAEDSLSISEQKSIGSILNDSRLIRADLVGISFQTESRVFSRATKGRSQSL